MTDTSKLIDGYVALISSGVLSDDLLSDDVFVDYNVPSWRFQTQGVPALLAQLADSAPDGAKVVVERSFATANGFVLEVEFCPLGPAGGDLLYRNLWLATVTDGQISELTLYCTGEWDLATRERQAREAPMLRP